MQFTINLNFLGITNVFNTKHISAKLVYLLSLRNLL